MRFTGCAKSWGHCCRDNTLPAASCRGPLLQLACAVEVTPHQDLCCAVHSVWGRRHGDQASRPTRLKSTFTAVISHPIRRETLNYFIPIPQTRQARHRPTTTTTTTPLSATSRQNTFASQLHCPLVHGSDTVFFSFPNGHQPPAHLHAQT